MVNVRILKTIHFERWEESPAEGLCHEVPIGLPLNAARAGQLPQGLLMAPDYIWYLQMCWKYEAIWVWVWVKITKTCFFPDLRSKGIPWETYTKFLSIFFSLGPGWESSCFGNPCAASPRFTPCARSAGWKGSHAFFWLDSACKLRTCMKLIDMN